MPKETSSFTNTHTPSNGWLLLFVQSGQERKIAERLREKGHEVLQPLYPIDGGAHSSSEPLFPRYLFVRHSNALNPVALRSITGVRNVVDLGRQRCPQGFCDDDWVQGMMRRLTQKLRHVEDGTQRSIELLMACSTPPLAKRQ